MLWRIVDIHMWLVPSAHFLERTKKGKDSEYYHVNSGIQDYWASPALATLKPLEVIRPTGISASFLPAWQRFEFGTFREPAHRVF